jgi:hypothetical protein
MDGGTSNIIEDKTKLVSNKSEDDLIYKEEATLPLIETHKNKKPNKSTIKPFHLNMAEVTGIPES